MRRMRTKWGSRLMAVTLVASLLPALVAPAAPVADRVSCVSYAQWLRTQVRAPADAGFEAALEAASASGSRSIQAFLRAFVAAYEAERPQADLASVFAPSGLSDDALITYLQGRYQRVAPEAMPPRGTLLPTPAPTGFAPDRAGLASDHRRADAPLLVQQVAASWVDRAAPVLLLIRVLSSARPMGP